MKSPASPPLDETSIQALTDIMVAAGSAAQGIDAVHYRAQHEERLGLLDKLENQGYLRKENGEYLVTVCGLETLDTPNSRDSLHVVKRFFQFYEIITSQNLQSRSMSLVFQLWQD